jgi:hypothetical protein
MSCRALFDCSAKSYPLLSKNVELFFV